MVASKTRGCKTGFFGWVRGADRQCDPWFAVAFLVNALSAEFPCDAVDAIVGCDQLGTLRRSATGGSCSCGADLGRRLPPRLSLSLSLSLPLPLINPVRFGDLPLDDGFERLGFSRVCRA